MLKVLVLSLCIIPCYTCSYLVSSGATVLLMARKESDRARAKLRVSIELFHWNDTDILFRPIVSVPIVKKRQTIYEKIYTRQ